MEWSSGMRDRTGVEELEVTWRSCAEVSWKDDNFSGMSGNDRSCVLQGGGRNMCGGGSVRKWVIYKSVCVFFAGCGRDVGVNI